ncbi:hypothetical protein OC845_005252 [Tilletia horrida]|nr:hypothetical protein OC845_005252 [Tilletia horrida]
MLDEIKVPKLPPGTRLVLKVPTPDELLDFANSHFHNNKVFDTFAHAIQHIASQHPSGLPVPDSAILPFLHIDLPLPRTTDLFGNERPPSPGTQLRLLEEEEIKRDSTTFGELLPGETEEEWQQRFGFTKLTLTSFKTLVASGTRQELKNAEEGALQGAELKRQEGETQTRLQNEASTLELFDFFFGETDDAEQQQSEVQQENSRQPRDESTNTANLFNPTFSGLGRSASPFDFTASFDLDQALLAPQHNSSLAAAVQAAQEQALRGNVPSVPSSPLQNVPGIGGNLAAALAIATATAAGTGTDSPSGPQDGNFGAKASSLNDYYPLSPDLTAEPLPPAFPVVRYDLDEDGFQMLDGPTAATTASSPNAKDKPRESATGIATVSPTTSSFNRAPPNQFVQPPSWRAHDSNRATISSRIVDRGGHQGPQAHQRHPSGFRPGAGTQAPYQHAQGGLASGQQGPRHWEADRFERRHEEERERYGGYDRRGRDYNLDRDRGVMVPARDRDRDAERDRDRDRSRCQSGSGVLPWRAHAYTNSGRQGLNHPRDYNRNRNGGKDRRANAFGPRQGDQRSPPVFSRHALPVAASDRDRPPLGRADWNSEFSSSPIHRLLSRPWPTAPGSSEYFDRDGAAVPANEKGLPSTSKEAFRAGLFGGKGVPHNEGHNHQSAARKEMIGNGDKGRLAQTPMRRATTYEDITGPAPPEHRDGRQRNDRSLAPSGPAPSGPASAMADTKRNWYGILAKEPEEDGTLITFTDSGRPLSILGH